MTSQPSVRSVTSSQADSAVTGVDMRQSFGLLGGISYVVGVMIGEIYVSSTLF